MSHEDDSSALAGKSLHGSEQAFGFFLGKHCSRLVQNQYLGAGQQNFENFHALLFSDGKLINAGVGINPESDAIRHGTDVVRHPAQAFPVKSAGLEMAQVQQDILGNREGRHQLEMLVNHSDAEFRRFFRAFEFYRVVINEQRSAFGAIEAGHDVHQGRLSGSVFAQQGMNFAPPGSEVSVGQGLETVEGLADAAQLDRVLFTHCCVITPSTNQSICQSAPSDTTSPSAARIVPFWSVSGPA